MRTVRSTLDFRSHREDRLSKASVWRARACDPCGTGVDVHVAKVALGGAGTQKCTGCRKLECNADLLNRKGKGNKTANSE